MNRFRTKVKKLSKFSGHEKGASDPSSIKPSVVGAGGPGSPAFLGVSSKENRRKAASVSGPPEVSSPVHQQMRKVSLSADSPSHSRTPTSPLVNAKLPILNSTENIDGCAHSAPNGTVSVSSRCSTPVLALPRVSVDDQGLDRQGIIDITVNVHSFLAAISKLRKAMEDYDNQRDDVLSQDGETASAVPSPSPVSPSFSQPEFTDVIVSHVTNLIQVVQTCLSEHSSMQSTAIKDAAKNLMNTYQSCDHANPSTCTTCNTAIESLIDAFTNSIQEYLTGESRQTDTPYLPPAAKELSHHQKKGFSKSHDNLSSKFSSYVDLSQQFSDAILDDIDQALFSVEGGTDVAASYIKRRIKYHKEVVSYLSKRAQIELRYMQQMSSLGTKTSRTLNEMKGEHQLPLINVFLNSVEEDMRLASNCYTTYNQQVGSKLVEPFEHKISDCERRRKEYNTTWRNEKKKLIEAKTVMKNAMSKYRFLGEDMARVKNLLALDPYGKQAEKRKKEVSDLEMKWQEAELAYKNAVAECNDCQYQVHITSQRSILCAYRRMVIDFDIQLKSGLETYFTLQQNFFTSLPEPMVKQLEDAQEYKIGSEFMEYLGHCPRQREEPEDYLFEEFDPEADSLMETTENYAAVESSGVSSSHLPNSTSSDSTFLHMGDEAGAGAGSSDRVPSPQPFIDSQTTLSVLENKAAMASPRAVKRKRPHSELYDGGTADAIKQGLSRRNSEHAPKDSVSPPTATPLPVAQGSVRSKMALTHTFKKLRGPARCRECDTYVYFHGHECDICGLACHKKCLETLAIRCGNKRLARKMNTFGVDFHKHLKATKRYIPIIVTKCIEEIDERALDTRGLYRISSAKTKLEHLCQLFESGADRVDLSDRPSHLIGSCLKLYFRQLPEPLLTFGFYHDFVTFARECSYILPCNMEMVTGEKRDTAEEMLGRLRGLLQKLPYENYITLAKLLYHLNKVSHPDHVKHNFMPPGNLGIVFGPNLLRQREQVASLALLADMTAQAKAIEIMISHVNDLFHMSEEQVQNVEHEYEDNNSYTKEVNVDEPLDSIKSPQLDVDDFATAGSRTPYNTPPERRRENVYELGEVLEVLQSVGRRNSDSYLKPPHPNLGEVRDHHISTSLPTFTNFPSSVGTDESTLSNLGRYLRASSGTPMEKMLTPVEERPTEVEEGRSPFLDDEDTDDDTCIVALSSQKIDGTANSRSASGLSNPGASWGSSEVSSTKDSVSILSGGDGVERPAGCDKSKEEGMSILGRISQQESTKDLLSQSSEEECCQLDSVPSVYDKMASSAEETASQQIPDSPHRHDVFAEHSPRSLPPYAKRNSLRGGEGGSQRSSPLSSTSHATVSSQSSYSEMTGDEGSVGEQKQRKYSISGKYARYEAYRSASVAIEDTTVDEVKEADASCGYSQSSTQESVATLTSDQCELEKVELGGGLASKETSSGRSHHKEGGDSRDGDERGEGSFLEGGVNAHLLDRKLSDIKDSLKHCDSGIDETPDANKSFKDGIRRYSVPPSSSEEGVMIPDPLPLSRALVASRESGLADSPDPETFADEVSMLKVVKPRALRSAAADQRDGDHLCTEEVEISISSQRCDVEEEEEEEEDDSGIIMEKTKADRFVSSYERPRSVPRSLENPSFSRYARTPIRDSRFLRSGEFQDTGGLKYRSISMDRISSSFSSGGEPSNAAEQTPVSLRSHTISTSRSAAVLLTPVRHPIHPPVPVQAKNAHPNQRFCVNPELTPPSPLSPSATHPNLHPDLFPTASPSDSPVMSEKRRGKRIKDKLKPALRVFRITPSSALSPSPVLQDTPQEEDEEEEEGIPSTPDTPDSSVILSPLALASGQRVRMASPEAMSTRRSSSRGTLRRSQSSEDILDSRVRGMGEDGEEEDYEADQRGSEGRRKGAAVVGPLMVIPEPKYKSRGKFFSKFKGRRGVHKRGSSSPVVLTKYGYHSMGEGSLSTSSSFSSVETGEHKRNKKRHRTPHFV